MKATKNDTILKKIVLFFVLCYNYTKSNMNNHYIDMERNYAKENFYNFV